MTKEKIKQMFLLTLPVLVLVTFSKIKSDELSYRFKSPSFSGINTSSHYLTIENQETNRIEKIKEDAQTLLDDLERDAENSVEARFLRNFTSRVYAQLSRQLTEQLFGETKKTEGTLELEGNTIEYMVDENETITLTITDEQNGVTTISIPIGDFTF